MIRFQAVSLIANDAEASLAFYRLLGIEAVDNSGGGGDIVHVVFAGSGTTNIDIDNSALGELYHAGFRNGPGGRLIIGFEVESRERVDELYALITGAGHEGRQPPYDPFWGARYAIVADPDGNDVGIMSPVDDTMRSWPPTPSPNL